MVSTRTESSVRKKVSIIKDLAHVLYALNCKRYDTATVGVFVTFAKMDM